MPDPALGKIQMLTPNGLRGSRDYVGDFKVHLPAITSPPGDGLINEVDWTFSLPSHPGLYLGLYIGNDNDGDPSRFATGQVLDSTAFPPWVTYFDSGNVTSAADWGEALSIVIWDGNWDAFTVSPATFITLDAGNSDPDWENFTGPHIDSFSPTTGEWGATVVLTGVGFSGASDVYFYVLAAGFTVDSDTQITATLGSDLPGVATKPGVVTPSGSISAFEDFTILGPIITSISPTHGRPGDLLTIHGAYLADADEVFFFDIDVVPVTSATDTEVTVVIPEGSPGTYEIQVQKSGGWATVSQFWFVIDALPAPVIRSIDPDHGVVGTTVTVRGSGFSDATEVDFSGGTGTSLIVIDDGALTIEAPSGVATGPISVTAPGGTVTSTQVFSVVGAPLISSVSPNPTRPGCGVTVAGSGFTYATDVSINAGDGPVSVPFSIGSDSVLMLQLPDDVTGSTEPDIAHGPKYAGMTVTVSNDAGAADNVDLNVYDIPADDYLYPRPAPARDSDDEILLPEWRNSDLADFGILKLSDHGAGDDEGVFLFYGTRVTDPETPDTYQGAIQLIVYGIGDPLQETEVVWTEPLHADGDFQTLACAVGPDLIVARTPNGYQAYSWTASGYHLNAEGSTVGGGELGGPFQAMVPLGSSQVFVLGSDTAFRDHEVLDVATGTGVSVASDGLFTHSFNKAWPIDDDRVLLFGYSAAAPTALSLCVYTVTTNDEGPFTVVTDNHVAVTFTDATHFYALASYTGATVLGFYSIGTRTVDLVWSVELLDFIKTATADPQGSVIDATLMELVPAVTLSGDSYPDQTGQGPILVAAGLSNYGDVSAVLEWAIDPTQAETGSTGVLLTTDLSHYLGFGPGRLLLDNDDTAYGIELMVPKADGRLVCVRSTNPHPTWGQTPELFLVDVATANMTCTPFVRFLKATLGPKRLYKVRA